MKGRKNRKKQLLIIGCALTVTLFSLWGYNEYTRQKEIRIAREQQEAKEEARKEKLRIQEKKQKERGEKLEAEAVNIVSPFKDANTDELVCSDLTKVYAEAKRVLKEADAFRETYKGEELEVLAAATKILEQAEEEANVIREIKKIDDSLSAIYNGEEKSVAMNTNKNDRIFRDVQTQMWKIPEIYPKKIKQYEAAVKEVSRAWNYKNDKWNYETSTLKITVEERQNSYTKYWVCHIQTFSPSQLNSALCGGTYGNPRVPVSQEIEAHKGVIGINGSGFSYSTGEPAPGKSMIKESQVYNDIYSNGNIMCVTKDGGMFTAIAGMTTEEMLNRQVRDTYCFGPTLVENGKPYEISGDFNQTYRYQRSAVGMVSPGNYYLVVVDGKGAGGSQGMTYEELRQVFLDLGCQYAYNMDGGGSATLVFKGRVLNSLTDGGRERPCADILYFIDAGDGGEGEDILIHEEEAMLRPTTD